MARRAVDFIFINELLAIEAPIFRHVYFKRSNGDLNLEFLFGSLQAAGANSFNRLLSSTSAALAVSGKLGLARPDDSDQKRRANDPNVC